MNKNTAALLKLFILFNLFILALMAMPDHASAAENSAIWKHQVPGDFYQHSR